MAYDERRYPVSPYRGCDIPRMTVMLRETERTEPACEARYEGSRR